MFRNTCNVLCLLLPSLSHCGRASAVLQGRLGLVFRKDKHVRAHAHTHMYSLPQSMLSAWVRCLSKIEMRSFWFRAGGWEALSLSLYLSTSLSFPVSEHVCCPRQYHVLPLLSGDFGYGWTLPPTWWQRWLFSSTVYYVFHRAVILPAMLVPCPGLHDCPAASKDRILHSVLRLSCCPGLHAGQSAVNIDV